MEFYDIAVMFPDWAGNALIPKLRMMWADKSGKELSPGHEWDESGDGPHEHVSFLCSGELSITSASTLVEDMAKLVRDVCGPFDASYGVAMAIAPQEDGNDIVHIRRVGGPGDESRPLDEPVECPDGKSILAAEFERLAVPPARKVQFRFIPILDQKHGRVDRPILIVGGPDEFSETGEKLYWNNELGWCSRAQADIFNYRDFGPYPVGATGVERLTPLPAECASQVSIARRRLYIDVLYEVNNATVKEIDAQLHSAADFLANEGLLSGALDATVVEWSAGVTHGAVGAGQPESAS